jgi:AraC-like DNA-binding protein
MKERKPEGRVLFRSDARTPLGGVMLAAVITRHPGMPPEPMRVYGSYAMTFVLRGEGEYRDERNLRIPLQSGDIVLVFPEIAHNYRPPAGRVWDESYFVFTGPAFEFLRSIRLFDPERPVIHIGDIAAWHRRLTAVLTTAHPLSEAGETARVAHFAAALAEMLSESREDKGQPAMADALARARELLGADLASAVAAEDVAKAVGMPYETFRKRFTQSTGLAPAHYRLRRRIEAAADLLRYTAMSHAEIAEALGFSDEFAFSKRFKAEMGMPPREFRKGINA